MDKLQLNFRESFLNLTTMKVKNYYGQDHDKLGGKQFYQSLTGRSGKGFFTKTAIVKKICQYRTDISKLNEVTVESPLDFGDILVWVFNSYEYHNYKWNFSSHYPLVTFSLHVETGLVFIDLIDSDTIDLKSIIEKIRSGYKDPDMDLPYKPFDIPINNKITFYNYEISSVHINMNGLSGIYIPLKLMFSQIFVGGDNFLDRNMKVIITPKGDILHKIGITENGEINVVFFDEQGLYPIRQGDIKEDSQLHDVNNDIKVDREDSEKSVTIFVVRDLRVTNYFQLVEINKSDNTYLVSEIRISEEKFMLDFDSDEEKVKEMLQDELHAPGALTAPDGSLMNQVE